MIYEVKMFAGNCDNCKVEIMAESEYSCLGEESAVKDDMMDAGWIEHEGKHYCPDCFEYDNNDEITIK